MRIQNLKAEDALAAMQSRLSGLTDAESRNRLSEFGPNVIEREQRPTALRRFLGQFTHFFAIILWLASALCFVSAQLQTDTSLTSLGFAIIAVIIINAAFSFWQEMKAERALEALQRILPKSCRVLRSGQWQTLSVEQLVPGDIIELAEGDDIGADARILESTRVRIDTSHITGESQPSSRHSLPCETREILWAKNLLLAGTSVVAGRAKAMVFATGTRTEFGRIVHLTLSGNVRLSPLQKEIGRVSRWIGIFSCLLGILFFAFGIFTGMPLSVAFLFGIGIIVANVPEGLMPTISMSLALAAQRMTKRKALVRHLPAVETLGSTTVICTDKTGTITLNELKVKEIVWQQKSVSARNWQEELLLSKGQLQFMSTILSTHALNVQKNSLFVQNGDPLEIALVQFANQCRCNAEMLTRLAEIPFDNTRRRQSVVVDYDGALRIFCKGAPETILSLCQSIADDDGEMHGMSELDRQAILEISAHHAKKGYKLIAFACRVISNDFILKNADLESESVCNELESRLTYLGLVCLEDPLRLEVPKAVQLCRQAGIRVIMITGDHPETARVIAMESGIFSNDESRIVLGDELECWSKTQLQLALEHKEISFARVKADHKLRIVEALKEKKEIVAVTGDGVNDAPALKAADIGIAMGISGTDVARESSDMVLLDDNFATIVDAIEEGRSVYNNIRKFMTYILASNVPEAIPYIFFVVMNIPLPLSVLQILAIDLGTDLIPALGLGTEAPSRIVMSAQPRSRGSHLLDRRLLMKAYLWLGLWEAIAAMSCYFYVLYLRGWKLESGVSGVSQEVAEQAATATFTAIILTQCVNVFLCRGHSFHGKVNAPVSRLIWIGVGIEIFFVMTYLYFEPMRTLMKTQPLPISYFALVSIFMVLMALCDRMRQTFESDE